MTEDGRRVACRSVYVGGKTSRNRNRNRNRIRNLLREIKGSMRIELIACPPKFLRRRKTEMKMKVLREI